MKLYAAILIFFLSFCCRASSQGFDWQYSSRMPVEYPVFYAGVGAGVSFQNHFGSFEFLEPPYSCGSFDGGSGVGTSFGVSAEYWTSGPAAFEASLSYSSVPGSFAYRQTLPRADLPSVITEFNFKSTLSCLNAGFGAKYRLFGSHFHISAGFDLGVLINKKFKFTESVIAPADYYFETNPPSQDRTLEYGGVGPINTFIIMPRIGAGLDINLGRGAYASAGLNAGYSLIDVAKDGNWQRMAVSIILVVRRGIF